MFGTDTKPLGDVQEHEATNNRRYSRCEIENRRLAGAELSNVALDNADHLICASHRIREQEIRENVDKQVSESPPFPTAKSSNVGIRSRKSTTLLIFRFNPVPPIWHYFNYLPNSLDDRFPTNSKMTFSGRKIRSTSTARLSQKVGYHIDNEIACTNNRGNVVEDWSITKDRFNTRREVVFGVGTIRCTRQYTYNRASNVSMGKKQKVE